MTQPDYLALRKSRLDLISDASLATKEIEKLFSSPTLVPCVEIEKLAARGAFIGMGKRPSGKSPFTRAIQNNDRDALILLVKIARAEGNLDEGALLHMVISKDRLTMLKDLLKMGLAVDARPGNDEHTPLQLAVLMGKLATAKFLIAQGASVDLEVQDQSFHSASGILSLAPNLKMLSLLLDSGADPNAIWWDNVDCSVLMDHIRTDTPWPEKGKMLELLISHGSSLFLNGDCADQSVLSALLSNGGLRESAAEQVKLASSKGIPPCWEEDMLSTAQVLIDQGCPISEPPNCPVTAAALLMMKAKDAIPADEWLAQWSKKGETNSRHYPWAIPYLIENGLNKDALIEPGGETVLFWLIRHWKIIRDHNKLLVKTLIPLGARTPTDEQILEWIGTREHADLMSDQDMWTQGQACRLANHTNDHKPAAPSKRRM